MLQLGFPWPPTIPDSLCLPHQPRARRIAQHACTLIHGFPAIALILLVTQSALTAFLSSRSQHLPVSKRRPRPGKIQGLHLRVNASLNVAPWAPPLLYLSPGPEKTHPGLQPTQQDLNALCIISCCCVINHPQNSVA